MKCVKFLFIFMSCFVRILASTHWMVTESGLIQQRENSPFQMARPYDLLAFLNQDTRWDNIINLYYDLSKRQEMVNRLWSTLEKDTDVGSKLGADKNCLKVVGSLNDIDLYITQMEDGVSRNIPVEEYQFYIPEDGQDKEMPDCKKISSLTFSMFAFEHLEGMIKRNNLSITAERYLPGHVAPIMTQEQFGHWVATALKRNSSSWLHYNIGSIYWRVRGNAAKAIECSRRAVFYAPRRYKDIPLLNLGTILHRSEMTKDAIVVLGAAVDHNPDFFLNHFTLANVYAVLGDFNSSLTFYDKCVNINPEFALGVKYRYAALCQRYMKMKMQGILRTLDKLREELKEYGYRESHWLRSQAAFLRTMKHNEEFDYKNVEKNCLKMAELTGLSIRELKKGGDKNSLIQYFLDGSMYSEKMLEGKGVSAVETAYNVQRLIRHIEKHTSMLSNFMLPPEHSKLINGRITEEIGPIPTFPDSTVEKINIETKKEIRPPKPDKKMTNFEDNISEFEDGVVLYPPSLNINRNKENFDKDVSWPSNKFCLEYGPQFPKNVEAVFPVFLPFENKGLRVGSILSDKIGVSVTTEHDLPWHPPTCPQDKETASFTRKNTQRQTMNNEVIKTEHLHQKLLEYVGDGNVQSIKHMQDAEIGQRIYTAMQMKVAPKWILYTLASLYWRVRGNNLNALNCLISANKLSKPKYKDIVLVSLSSLFLEMGYFEDALVTAEEAFRISLYEPATNFLLSELNMLKKHRNTHMFHLKQVVRVQPQFMNGLARNLLNAWSCLLKQVSDQQDMEDYRGGDVCTQIEPSMSMVCEKDGTNCHMANIHCFNAREREGSTLVKMLELKDEEAEKSSADDLNGNMFADIIENMPSDLRDIEAHTANFDRMRVLVDTALKGCGSRGCSSIQAKDLLLQEDDCSYQHLQLGYWLYVVCFRQLLQDSNFKLPEISNPSSQEKKEPECHIPVDTSKNFVLDRLSKIQTSGWEPALTLMHQLAELLDCYDYRTLGDNIARFIENEPRSWLGALAAAWWCGALGKGHCAVTCLSAAHALIDDPAEQNAALRAAHALLHTQTKSQEAKEIAYLAFYLEPKNKIDIFLVAFSHTYLSEYEQAVWMYRYALTFDSKFLPAKACLHASMCLMLFGDKIKPKDE